MTYGSDAIYLDHAATTPTDPAAVQAMLPYFSQEFGNPSSIYQLGQGGRAALDHARKQVASVLGCRASDVIFTSGATESANFAVKGIAWRARLDRPSDTHPMPHIITTAIEHHAVSHAVDALARQGFPVSVISCDADGLIDPAAIEAEIRPETCLITAMYANNEMGAIQPITEISAVAGQYAIPVHTDAVQAVGSLPVNVDDLGVAAMSLSAHKFYGPKGVGLLYLKKGTPITFQQDGGGQESGRRGGTENVPLIVGMAEAMVRADQQRERYNTHCRELRNALWADISARVPEVRLNGPDLDGPRLANNLNVSFTGVQGETVLLSLDMAGIAASAGSACTTGNSEPSHVLLAMGLTESDARASIRFSVGRGNSMDEIEHAADTIEEVVTRVRDMASLSV